MREKATGWSAEVAQVAKFAQVQPPNSSPKVRMASTGNVNVVAGKLGCGSKMAAFFGN